MRLAGSLRSCTMPIAQVTIAAVSAGNALERYISMSRMIYITKNMTITVAVYCSPPIKPMFIV